jgi:hypothetical protein
VLAANKHRSLPRPDEKGNPWIFGQYRTRRPVLAAWDALHNLR